MLCICTSGWSKGKFTEALFHNYTTDNGLPHSICQVVVEDAMGFVWIGTPSGLVRYDGVYFETFNDQNSLLPENNVTALYQSSNGKNLWVGTVNGSITCINISDNRFIPLEYDAHHVSRTGIGSVSSFCDFNENVLFVVSDRIGLMSIDQNTKVMKPVNIQYVGAPEKIFVRSVKAINHQFYVAAIEGVFVVEREADGEFYMNRILPGHVDARDLIRESDTTLLVAIRNELYRYYISSKKSELIDKFENNLRHIVLLPSGELWMSTFNSGLIYYDRNEKKAFYFRSGLSDYSLQDNNVFSFSSAQNGAIIWVGTKSGLSRLDNRFRSISYFDLNEYSDSKSSLIFLIRKDVRSNYWIWSVDGLFKKKNGENHFKRVPASASFTNKEQILSSAELPDGRIIFTSSSGLLEYSPIADRIERLPLKHNYFYHYVNPLSDGSLCLLSGNKIVRYCQTTKAEASTQVEGFTNLQLICSCNEGDSALWIGSNHGMLFRYDIAKNIISQSIKLPLNDKNLGASYITSIKLDNEGCVWMATQGGGLLKYSINENNFERVPLSSNVTESAYVLEKDKQGQMWTATAQGIININPKTMEKRVFSSQYYVLSSEYNKGTSSVTPDGNILMGGADGFNEFNPITLSVPDESFKPVVTSYIVFNNSVFSYEDKTKQLFYNPKDTIIVGRDFESLRLHVRMLNYLNTTKSRIAWRIEGLDTEWNYFSANQPIIYSNIPPGKRLLVIVPVDYDNLPSGEALKLLIHKKVYFYDHPLFKAFIIVMAFVLLLAYFVWRGRKLVRQREKLNEMVDEKTLELTLANNELMAHREEIVDQNKELEMHRRYLEDLVQKRTFDLEQAKKAAEESDKLKTSFLANLSHEIRTPMNSIMGFSTLLSAGIFSEEEKSDFIKHIQNSSESLLVLINDIVDISRIETNQLRLIPSVLDVSVDLGQIVQSLGYNRQKEGKEILTFIDATCHNVRINTDRERFKQVVINLINNACKFADNKEVLVSARIIPPQDLPRFHYSGSITPQNDPLLLVSVADRGIGIAPEYQETIFEPFRKIDNKEVLYPGLGLGLSIVKNLTRLLKGEVWLKSDRGEGSTFYFYIPAGNIFYDN